MHANVKPHAKCPNFATADQAICHLFNYGPRPQSWNDCSFGRDLAEIRRAIAAMNARDFSAFKAAKRRGYWRVELA